MPAKKKASSDDKDLLLRIRERYRVMADADDSNRRKALEDLKFLHEPGAQWEANQKKERGERPCYEFNKTRVTVKRIVNDMRANRPKGKVRATEDGDKDTAEVYEGLCRNIWNTSDGDTIIDNAAEYQVGGGMGAWRVETKYLSEESFSQDICVSPIKNPFCLYGDPAASDPLKRDGADWILTERISRKSYESRWPKAEVVSFDDVEFDDEDEWADDEMVRICEYWWKEPYEKTIYQTRDGRIVEEADAKLIPEEILKSRPITCHRIMMCIASGDAILEKPTEWAGRLFPFVQFYGEWLVIDGKVHWFGLARFAKDAQRAYNVSRTAAIEAVALAPNFKWWATPEQAKGHTDMWAEAHKKLYPFMLYNADNAAGGPPQSMPGPQVPMALNEQTFIASEEIKAVTGIYDASLGAQGNETSGKAINARQQQGEIATFNYADNLGKAIRLTWDIFVDLIPKVYDTERSMRVLGVDGSEKYVKVNQVVQDPATMEMVTINDLSRGKYDVTITVGPSFATQRMEAAEAYTELASRDPNVMAAAGDLVFKAMDLPYSEQIAERYRMLLPPPVQQMLSEGKTPSPEAMAALTQAHQMMAQVQEQGALIQQAAQESDVKKADAEKALAAVEKAISQLRVDKANFDAYVAKANADFELKQAEARSGEMQKGDEESRDQLGKDLQEAISALQQQYAEAIQSLVQTQADLLTRSQPQVIVANPPKRKVVTVERINGKLVGEVQEVA